MARIRRQPLRQVAQSGHIPAPTGGINTVSAGLALPAGDCITATNLMSAENGLRTRFGYREWCTGLVGVDSEEVRTIIPFAGATSASGKLFAATDNGIYEVTDAGASPSALITFGVHSGDAGFGSVAAFVTAAGHFLLFADEVNGLYVYAATGNSWTKVTQGTGASQIDGVNPAQVSAVAVYKGRLWLVERGTANAWYLPTGQIYGTATKFPLGSVFREGGYLVGLWNWTYDGGAGLDDSLVAVSSGGDVAVYRGTDPASASTFGLQGVWQIGAPPDGRRIGSTWGGDLLLLSRQGLVPLSRLVVGSVSGAEYATAKVSNLINRLMLEKANNPGWSVVLHPEDNSLVLIVPQASAATPYQLAQGVASRGWFLYEGLPMVCADEFGGQLFFGTPDGRVCVHSGYVDNVLLEDDTDFEPVSWQLLTAFSDLGSPRQKQVQMIRPTILAETGIASYSAEARYNYDQTPLDPVEVVLGEVTGAWDTAVWDVDEWSGDAAPTVQARGAFGMGSSVAIAIRGTATDRTVLVGIDVVYTTGGFL